MDMSSSHNATSVWQEISAWPARQRLALASRILQSLERETTSANVPDERRDALNRLLGIWKADSPPTDEEVRQIVEEERMKKYG